MPISDRVQQAPPGVPTAFEYPFEGAIGPLFIGNQVLSGANLAAVEEWVSAGTSSSVFVQPLPLVLIAGDSQSVDFPSTASPPWCNYVNDGLTNRAQWLNAAYPGISLAQAVSSLPLTYHNASRPIEAVILRAGTNDIVEEGHSDAQVYADLQAGCTTLQSTYGNNIIIADILPRTDCTGQAETYRQAYNARLATDFPHATSVPYVFSAGTGVNYAKYCWRCSTITALQDPTNTGNYVDGIHETGTAKAAYDAPGLGGALGLIGIS